VVEHAVQGPPATPRFESGALQPHVLVVELHAALGSVQVQAALPLGFVEPATQRTQAVLTKPDPTGHVREVEVGDGVAEGDMEGSMDGRKGASAMPRYSVFAGARKSRTGAQGCAPSVPVQVARME